MLEQVSACAGAKRLEYPLIVVVDRQHEQRELRMTLAQQANAFDARHAWQSDVHERYVWQVAGNSRQRFFHRAIASDTLISWSSVDKNRQSVAQVAAILDDRGSDNRGQRGY